MSRRRRRGAVLALAFVFGACTPNDGPAPTSPQDVEVPGDASARDDTRAPDPDVDLPEGWVLVVVPDEQTGPFQVAAPADAAVWQVGTPLGPLAEVAAGTPWWVFWEPRLSPLDPQTSNVRAMLAVPDEGAVRALQVNVTPYDLDVEPDDAPGIAQALALVARAQGNEVRSIEAVPYGGPQVDAVGQLVFRVDPQVLARDVWQRLIPVPDRNALWSVQCGGPAPADPELDPEFDPEFDPELETMCLRMLETFRPPTG